MKILNFIYKKREKMLEKIVVETLEKSGTARKIKKSNKIKAFYVKKFKKDLSIDTVKLSNHR